MPQQELRVNNDKYLDHVERSAVMFTIIILAVIAGLVGFGIGFGLAELLK